MTRRIHYVAQYEAYWALTEAQWWEIVRQGLTGEGYELPMAAELKHRPRCIRVSDGRPWIDTNRHTLHRPLDWQPDDWRTALEELAA